MIIYKTEDGLEFTSEIAAVKHDAELQEEKEKETASLIEAAYKIQEICRKSTNRSDCERKCPFYSKIAEQCIFSSAFGDACIPDKWILTKEKRFV
jgi:hypothetical protein